MVIAGDKACRFAELSTAIRNTDTTLTKSGDWTSLANRVTEEFIVAHLILTYTLSLGLRFMRDL